MFNKVLTTKQNLTPEQQSIILENIGAMPRDSLPFIQPALDPITRITAYYATSSGASQSSIPLEQLNNSKVKAMVSLTNRQALPDTKLTIKQFIQETDFLYLSVRFNIVARFADSAVYSGDGSLTKFTEDLPIEFAILNGNGSFIGTASSAHCLHSGTNAWDSFSGELTITKETLAQHNFDFQFGFKTIAKTINVANSKYAIVFPVLWLATDLVGISYPILEDESSGNT